VALLGPAHELVDHFVPNFTSEVLGIIITVAFVQRLLQRQERARRMRASNGEFRRGGRALTRLLTAWADILKVMLQLHRDWLSAAPGPGSLRVAPGPEVRMEGGGWRRVESRRKLSMKKGQSDPAVAHAQSPGFCCPARV
jgi:hypothetical protein